MEVDVRKLWKSILVFVLGIGFNNLATACTDIRIIAQDKSVIIARSMEFAEDMHSNLRTSPQGRVFNTVASDGTPGMSWTAKYGYIYLDGMNLDFAVDGFNEKGLSFEALYLPGLAGYQTVEKNQNKRALPYLNIGDWALSNFATVDEVRAALPSIVLFAQLQTGMGDFVAPLHFSFQDASGKGIVAEYINGMLSIYDNIGIMTNAPAYSWHTTNLNNYTQLKPTNPAPVIVDGVTYVATGQGSGMLGLPGDISPPSRFVKMAVMLSVVAPAADAKAAVNLAEHVINNVDIPFGFVREPGSGNYTSEYTQWVVFKDLTNKVFYYRTYFDMSLHAVNFANIDVSPKGPKLKMPIASQEYVNDLTAEFIKANA